MNTLDRLVSNPLGALAVLTLAICAGGGLIVAGGLLIAFWKG
ncbi:MAG: hypothetical protein ABSC47_00255 [Terracidiphilus sp.]|jgi:hypothetical protein